MRRGSRRAIFVGLVFPGILSFLALATILSLLTRAPELIVMQWSGGGASRYAPPAELPFLPAIAMAVSVLIWAVAPAGKIRDARFGLSIGNGVAAILNTSAVALLVSQLSVPATQSLPVAALVVSVLAGAIVALITFFATRAGLE